MHRHLVPTTWTPVWYWDCLTPSDFSLGWMLKLERHGDSKLDIAPWNHGLTTRGGDQATGVRFRPTEVELGHGRPGGRERPRGRSQEEAKRPAHRRPTLSQRRRRHGGARGSLLKGGDCGQEAVADAPWQVFAVARMHEVARQEQRVPLGMRGSRHAWVIAKEAYADVGCEATGAGAEKGLRACALARDGSRRRR